MAKHENFIPANLGQLNHAQLTERAHLIWEYVRRGWTYQATAQVIQEVHGFPCNISTVKCVAHEVAKEMHERFLDQALNERLIQVTVLQEKAMRAFIEFERSCQDVEMESVTQGKAVVTRDGDIVELPEQVVRTRKGQSGNPALLMAGFQAMSDVRRILGYNAPEEIALGPGEGTVNTGLEGKINTLADRIAPAELPDASHGS